MVVFVVFLLVIGGAPLYAHHDEATNTEHRVDSLEALIPTLRTPQERAAIWLALHTLTANHVEDKALVYAAQAVAVVDSFRLDALRREAYFAYESSLKRVGRFEESVQINLKALKYAERSGDVDWQIAVYKQLAWVFLAQEDYDAILPYMDKAEQLLKQQPMSLNHAKFMAEKGIVMQVLKRPTDALYYFEKAHSLYLSQGAVDKAKHLESVLFGEEDDAFCASSQSELNALTELARKEANQYLRILSMIKHAICLSKNNRCPEAAQEIDAAWRLADTLKNISTKKILASHSARIAEQCGDYERAFHFQTLLGAYKDSVTQIEKTNEISRVLLKQEQAERALLLEQNTRQTERAAIQRRQYMFISLFAFALVCIGVLVFWLRMAREKRRQEELLGQLYLIRLRPHFLYNILSSLQSIALRESPRRTVEIIGQVGQMFRNFFNASDWDYISLTHEREIMEDYISVQRLRFSFPFVFRFEVGEELDPEDTQIPPMLIQPFVENALEHGSLHQAADATITVSIHKHSDNCLRVEVSDNGKGMSAEAQAAIRKTTGKRTSGIAITRHRVALLCPKFTENSFTISHLKTSNATFPGTKITILLPSRTFGNTVPNNP